MSLAAAVIRLKPTARLGIDFSVQDDGKGPYIAKWDAIALGAQPTDAQLSQAAIDAETERIMKEDQDRQDRQLLRAFKDIASPTGAQIAAAMKAFIRLQRDN